MDKCKINIAIIEPSNIIYEGLSTLLLKSKKHFYLYRINDFDEFNSMTLKESINIVILNPAVIQNRLNDFSKLKKHHSDISWFGLIYSYFDNELLNKFNDTISISDPIEIITQKLNRSFNHCNCNDNSQEQLSEREIDVLIQLVKGLSNKEIADKLNISIHTVISHRKNIIEKTGIKSLSGLAIYAITKNIIPLDTTSL
ncbi:MAG: response regulator transcription factor [Marinilabiliaceae bacterium]|nr:response regulator transcription factor [Marinilabiliaceae bacterium]